MVNQQRPMYSYYKEQFTKLKQAYLSIYGSQSKLEGKIQLLECQKRALNDKLKQMD